MAKKTKKNSLTKIPEVDKYIFSVLQKKRKASEDLIKQIQIIEKEFREEKVECDLFLYDKYIKIGHLFFDELFPFQVFATAMCLCTFYKGTKRPRWNKALMEYGRGSGKDSLIAWWSCCLTSPYHGIKGYNIDIIANNMDQSLRPIGDIEEMSKAKNKKKFYEKVGDGIVSYKTNSIITARSSDAKMQDGLRSGCVIFNEVHAYENYKKLNVMTTGLGKVDEPRMLYFTTYGDVNGGVLDDLLDTAKDVLDGLADDRRTLYLIYRLKNIEEIADKSNWVKATPMIEHREALRDEIEDEYETWKRNPSNLTSFPIKRMNITGVGGDQEVVPWSVIMETKQDYDFDRLRGMNCVLGIDTSKTTDWTAVNFLFYDDEIEKYICINHAYICAKNRDLAGIKAPYQDWCNQGFGTIIDSKEVDPDMVIKRSMEFAEENDYNVVAVAGDNFKKQLFSKTFEEYGFTKEAGNYKIVRPSDIAEYVPIIERTFINNKFVWGDNPMLRWATNNTKVISWKRTKTTGDNDLGNQLYAKINPRFRKTDPFMALVHSMIVKNFIEEDYVDLNNLGFRGF